MLQIPWRDSSFSHGAEFIKIGTNPNLCDTNKKDFQDLDITVPSIKNPEHVWLLFWSEREKLKGSLSWQKSICLQILTFIVWLGIANRPTNLISSLQDIYIHQDNNSPTTQNRQQINTFTPSATPISEYPLQQVRKPSIKRLILWMKDLGDKSSPLSTKPSLEGQVSLKNITLHQGQVMAGWTGTKNSLGNHCCFWNSKTIPGFYSLPQKLSSPQKKNTEWKEYNPQFISW